MSICKNKKEKLKKIVNITGEIVMFTVITIFLYSCSNNIKEDNNQVISLAKRIENKELIPDNDFIFKNRNLKNILYPDTLYSNVTRKDFFNNNVQFFLSNLQTITITDSMILKNVNSYNIIFVIAEKHIQYLQKKTNNISETMEIFGHSLLEHLTRALEYNVNNGYINGNSQEVRNLVDKLEKYGHIADFRVSKFAKLCRNFKNGKFGYILNRIWADYKITLIIIMSILCSSLLILLLCKFVKSKNKNINSYEIK